MLASSFSRFSLVLKGNSATARHGLAAIHLSATKCGEDDFERKKFVQPILRELLYRWNDPDKRPVILTHVHYCNGPWERQRNDAQYPPPFMEEAGKKGQPELEQPPPFMKEDPDPPQERRQPEIDHLPAFMEEIPEPPQNPNEFPSRNPRKAQEQFDRDKPPAFMREMPEQSHVSPQRGMQTGQTQRSSSPSTRIMPQRGVQGELEQPPAFMNETPEQTQSFRPSSTHVTPQRGMQGELKQPPAFMSETPEQTQSFRPSSTHVTPQRGMQGELEQPPVFMSETPQQTQWSPPPSTRVLSRAGPHGGRQPELERPPAFMKERNQCYVMDINAYLWTCLENWNLEVFHPQPRPVLVDMITNPPIQAEPVRKRDQLEKEQIEREPDQEVSDFDVQSYLWGCIENWNWEELNKPKPKLSKSRYDQVNYNDNHGIDHDKCEDFDFRMTSVIFHRKEQADDSPSKESVTWKSASAVSQNRREVLSLAKPVSSTTKSWHTLSHKGGHRVLSHLMQTSASSTLLLCNAIHQEFFSSTTEASSSADRSVLSKEFCMRS